MAGRSDRPSIDGNLHPDFTPVARALREQLRTHSGGAAVCVYHEGECVVDLWGGVRDEDGAPWTRDTMAPSFSTTKGVASTVLHRLVDRGLLSYDDRVAKHWPEFAQSGKGTITVRHVLSHQSGLYHIRQMIDDAHRMLDWDHMIRAIERATPIHPPGKRTGYHGLTFGFLVGEILQRVSGKPFPELVREELVRPLGLDGMYVGAPEEALSRAARLIWPNRGFLLSLLGSILESPGPERVLHASGSALQSLLGVTGLELDLNSIRDALAPRGIGGFDFSSDATLRASIPAANGLFTARSLARMYAALAGGGSIDGVQLLSPETVAHASERQGEAAGRVVIPFDMRWRLGYHGVFTSRGVPRQAFGHFGFGGSGGWADPRRDTSVALIVNSGMGTPFGDMRVVRVGGAVLESVDRRRAARQRATRRRTATRRRPAAPAVLGANAGSANAGP